MTTKYLPRLLTTNINQILKSGKSILLLGPRQTGKTTLINKIKTDLNITLANPKARLQYEKEPFILTNEIEHIATKLHKYKPIIIIDEIQKLPILMDAVQDLIDRNIAQFILTGSSARKLKHNHYNQQVNLLPGRVIPLRLDPFIYREQQTLHRSLNKLLLDGDLPEITLLKNHDNRERLLDAYVTTYLEEEVRAEAIVRNIGHFARFLELAAIESGKIVNFSKLSQDIGIAHATIASYYQILEDCLIIERIEPITRSHNRRKLSKAQKYLFYDLGVRRIAANEGNSLSKEYMGHLFEQYIGLELIRNTRLQLKRISVKYWRDPNGPEVDWIIDYNNQYIPLEVKWTNQPTSKDAKHLQIFLNEYKQKTKLGFIICQISNSFQLAHNIYALPWQELSKVIKLLN